ncbi:cupin domain-containing protein [Thermodesulforhabdus norvegica]|uniref:Cupin domain-containing protein n=1 Tax=Thermodesulforhabdus norvegica TaxID=39841 RepID=A0A1I4S3G1_9BACT|nr:cupin domain-containing protein [Thermodesulforhabdus norvegica]SFM58989.1 Cupin domain-containing protein [Thermodesulforhabdus norvegica]
MKKDGTPVVPLTDLVDYQEGSIVSRAIVQKKSGTVTVFAFDEGQGLSEHTAPFDALVFVVDGEAEITLSDTVHRVNSGEMMMLPAGEPHSVRAVKPFKMLLVMVRE